LLRRPQGRTHLIHLQSPLSLPRLFAQLSLAGQRSAAGHRTTRERQQRRQEGCTSIHACCRQASSSGARLTPRDTDCLDLNRHRLATLKGTAPGRTPIPETKNAADALVAIMLLALARPATIHRQRPILDSRWNRLAATFQIPVDRATIRETALFPS
jgi:hypothetical protein